jgi:hypothetical protein
VDTPYFYLMDGDMRLREDFLSPALAYLEAHPGCAGVGGTVIETLIANEEFQIRQAAMAHEAHRREGPVDRLDGAASIAPPPSARWAISPMPTCNRLKNSTLPPGSAQQGGALRGSTVRRSNTPAMPPAAIACSGAALPRAG